MSFPLTRTPATTVRLEMCGISPVRWYRQVSRTMLSVTFPASSFSSSRNSSTRLNLTFMDKLLSLPEVKELAQLDVRPEGLRRRQPLDVATEGVVHRPEILAVLLASHGVFLGNR